MTVSASTPKTLRTQQKQKVPPPYREVVPFAFAFILLFSSPALAGTYGENLKYGLKRGLKNTLGAPAEIAVTVQDYHERAGWPFVRQGAGLLAGAGKMLVRFGSGLVDFGAAWVPGLQGGLPVKPEVLF